MTFSDRNKFSDDMFEILCRDHLKPNYKKQSMKSGLTFVSADQRCGVDALLESLLDNRVLSTGYRFQQPDQYQYCISSFGDPHASIRYLTGAGNQTEFDKMIADVYIHSFAVPKPEAIMAYVMCDRPLLWYLIKNKLIPYEVSTAREDSNQFIHFSYVDAINAGVARKWEIHPDIAKKLDIHPPQGYLADIIHRTWSLPKDFSSVQSIPKKSLSSIYGENQV